jgi:hypothetical protein
VSEEEIYYQAAKIVISVDGVRIWKDMAMAHL